MFQRKIRSYFIFIIDSTFSGSIARYINDTPERYANCKIEKIINQGRPHLILVVKKRHSSEYRVALLLWGYKEPSVEGTGSFFE